MTKKTIEKYYDAFNRRDHKALLSLLHDNVIHEINQGKTQIGKAQFDQFLKKMDECYAEILEKIEIFLSSDNRRAAAEFEVHGTYLKTDGEFPKATGQKYVIRAGGFFEIDDQTGLIKRVTTYYNLPHWIELISTV